MNTQSIGESQIDKQTIERVAPDVLHPDGQGQLFQKAVQANVAKQQLDAVIGAVANHLNASTNSRIKQIETATKKIAQKRLQGREYSIEDVNDMLGARLVLPNKSDFPRAKQAIQKLSSAGVFDITKEQQVKQDTYEAYHFDVTMGNGTKAEIQLHTPQSEAEAVSNHTLRSQFGEDPTGAVSQLKNKQAQAARKLPNEKAQAVSQAIQLLSKQQNGNVAPTQTAQVLQQATQQ